MILAVAIFWASHYSPGVMEQVIVNRQTGNAWVHLPSELPMVDGYAAVQDCSRLGEVLYLRPVGAQSWESFLVVDCAMLPGTDGAHEWMTENNIGVEVDYETALRWGTAGGGVKVESGWKPSRIGGYFP